MSQVYIPEPLTVPALWEPWRKPYSPVSVNLDHPLARGLKVYTLGGRNLLNAPGLINNSVPSKGGDFNFTGVAGQYISMGDRVFASPAFSVVLVLRIRSIVGAYPMVFSNGNSASRRGAFIFYHTARNRLEVALYNASSLISAPSMSFDILGSVERTVVVTSDGVSACKMFTDGDLDVEDSISTPQIVASDADRITRLGDSPDNFWGHLDGPVSRFSYYDRALSDIDAKFLSLNPNAVLKVA
jgi:hypothetical protein